MSFTFLALGCHSPGPYGYAADYAPLDAEEAAANNAVDFDPVMAGRDRKSWSSKVVSAFGIVEERVALKNGKTKLVLNLRTLSPRNLCDEGGEETCRVTVSAKGYGELTATAKLSPDDDVGRDSLKAGSLVRVVGRLVYGDRAEGSAPILDASFYRHWPFRQFVTTQARDYLMR
ncbi:MAG: hypothetical protein SFV15_22220 [Polyangiaceae bacterium]|nr:hypothetical protein [Polyangiaceae bacterium]